MAFEPCKALIKDPKVVCGSFNFIFPSFHILRSYQVLITNTTITTSRLLGETKAQNLVKMKSIVFIVFVLFETRAFAIGRMDLVPELSEGNREVLVKWACYGEEKLSTVVIGGKLLCHDARNDNTTPLQPSPVSGASVAVFCGTNGKTKKSWAKGSTNIYGEFLIDLPSHLHAVPNLEKVCVIKVLQIPKSSPCQRHFTGKHKCIKLTSIDEGIRIYTTHNIHLMSKPSQDHKKRGLKKGNTASVA